MRGLILAVLIAFATVGAIAQESEQPAAEEKKFKPPPGFKTRTRGDETYYCRRVVPIGSHFPVETCYTKEQLEEYLVKNEEQRQEFERQRRLCATPEICRNE